jgi:PAS domain S-box-containing protein
MKTNDPMSKTPTRAKAESLARDRALLSAENLAEQSMDDIRSTLHELRVREIELSLQNEELRRTQLELGAAHDRYVDLYDLAPVGYCTVNPAGLIMEANLTFASLVGMTRSELVSRPFHLFVQRADRLQEYLYRQRVLRSRDPLSLELRMTRSDGTDWWAHLEGNCLDDAGTPGLCRLVIIDISRKVRMADRQERLVARQQEIRRLDSLGQLAGGVAHELNNMLCVIFGHGELALENLDPGHPLASHFEEISRAAIRSAALAQNLLGFASLQPVRPAVLDLNEFMRGIMAHLRQLIGPGIQMSWQPHSSPLPVSMDPKQLEQILVNLCNSARESICDSGRINIDSGEEKVSADFSASHGGTRPGPYVWLAVRDSGAGMDGQTLPRIFEPFFSTKGFGRGKGIGLASVYGIVRQSGGFIVAQSEPGHGASFTVHLPRHLSAAAPARSAGGDHTPTEESRTVLLIEDEKAVLDVVIVMLERLGYTVLATSDATDAYRLATEHLGAIHILITDVIMPAINGKDLATRLMSTYPDLRLLFISGYPADIIARHGVLDSGIHFLQKPFSLAELRGKIGEILNAPN